MSSASYQTEDSLPITAELSTKENEPTSFVGKAVTAFVLSVTLVCLALASQYPTSGSSVSGMTSLNEESIAVHAKHSAIANKALYCPKVFKKGDSRFVPASCSMFAKNDLNWAHMVDSNVLYVCASKTLSPIDIKEGTFDQYGIEINEDNGMGVSLIKTGEKARLAIYEGKFEGDKDAIEQISDHSLISHTYAGDKIENDAVESAMMYSEAPLMPVSCEDLFEYIDSKR